MATATAARSKLTVTLELSQEEAQVLRFILGSCVTGADDTPRQYSKSVWKALSDLLGKYDLHATYPVRGGIQFTERMETTNG